MSSLFFTHFKGWRQTHKSNQLRKVLSEGCKWLCLITAFSLPVRQEETGGQEETGAAGAAERFQSVSQSVSAALKEIVEMTVTWPEVCGRSSCSSPSSKHVESCALVLVETLCLSKMLRTFFPPLSFCWKIISVNIHTCFFLSRMFFPVPCFRSKTVQHGNKPCRKSLWRMFPAERMMVDDNDYYSSSTVSGIITLLF